MSLALGTVTLFGALLAGCSGSGGQAPADAKAGQAPSDAKAANKTASTEPVTLKIFNYNAGIMDKDVEDLFKGPVQKKYPNINFELVTGKTLDQLVAAGEIPDLIPTSNFYLNDLVELGLTSDLSDFVKQERIDLSRFQPEAIDTIKQFGKQGELVGMPYTMNYGAMFYNKAIFDKFGVPYPKDGMTWNQLIELSKQLTKKVDGVQYIGMDPGDANALTRTYSLPVSDEKQEKSLLTTEGYQKVFSLLKQVYDIPGMVSNDNKYTYGINAFIKDQRVAMIPYWLAAFTSRIPQINGAFDWDMVSYPTFDDRPGVGREIDFHMLVIPPTTKHREAALQVVQTLISDEAQKAMNRGTRLTILKDSGMQLDFAADSKLYEGKNLAGIFKVKPAPVAHSPLYEQKVYALLRDALKDVVVKKTDINTALRTADEKANQIITDSKKNAKK